MKRIELIFWITSVMIVIILESKKRGKDYVIKTLRSAFIISTIATIIFFLFIYFFNVYFYGPTIDKNTLNQYIIASGFVFCFILVILYNSQIDR